MTNQTVKLKTASETERDKDLRNKFWHPYYKMKKSEIRKVERVHDELIKKYLHKKKSLAKINEVIQKTK